MNKKKRVSSVVNVLLPKGDGACATCRPCMPCKFCKNKPECGICRHCDGTGVRPDGFHCRSCRNNHAKWSDDVKFDEYRKAVEATLEGP